MTQLSTVYRPEQREIGAGDRIQLTARDKEQGIRSRDLGTVIEIAADNRLTVRLDNGKTVEIDPYKARYIEHGYTVEGTKNFHAQRVLVSIGGPAEVAAESALARAISRSSASTTFYTSDGPSLAETQAAERARIDRTIRSAPTTAEIARHFPPSTTTGIKLPSYRLLSPRTPRSSSGRERPAASRPTGNTEIGRNIHIDGKGQFYTQEGKPTSQEAALERARPVGYSQSLNKVDNSMSLGR